MNLKQLAFKKGMKEPNAKTQSFFKTDRVQLQIATTRKEKNYNGILDWQSGK